MYPSIPSLLEQVRQMEQAGDMPAAFRLVRQALQLARQSGDLQEMANCMVAEATLYFRLGRYIEATSCSRQVLQLSPEASPARAEALLMLGMCTAETFSLSQAERYFHQAADLARQIDYPRARARPAQPGGRRVYPARALRSGPGHRPGGTGYRPPALAQ